MVRIILPLFSVKMISRLADALFAVFNSLCRAKAYASHAVGAVSAPYGSLVFQLDIVERAKLHAFPAADTFIGCRKGISLYK